MKVDELTLRVYTYMCKLIDLYLPHEDFINKMKNATCKYWLKLNMDKIKPIFYLFADCDGNINVDELIRMYENTIFENDELRLNVHKMIPRDYEWIKGMLPDKIVVITKNEMYSIFGKTC